MNIAILLRYVDMKKESTWDHRYYIMRDYLQLAKNTGGDDRGYVGI